MFNLKPSIKDEADIPGAAYQPVRFSSWMIGRLVISFSMSSSHARAHRPGATLHNRIAILRVEHGMSRQDLARRKPGKVVKSLSRDTCSHWRDNAAPRQK